MPWVTPLVVRPRAGQRDQIVTTPMPGALADSLNIGVAACVVLFDLARRRRERDGLNTIHAPIR